MVLSVVLLDHQENFVKFLNPEYITIKESCETGKVRRISVSYAMQSLYDAKNLFKIGYKLWISGDENLIDCLYVINTSVERDYFQKNNVAFNAEEVLVELNYAPLFSQLDLIAENGFTITTINDQENVTVDYPALKFWFGDYFNIGVVQKCLSTYVSRITPVGTMTKMELLRFIEKETSNVFVTRYEKDVMSNTIHRYLDFLNPNNNDKDWELNINHQFKEDLASTNISLYDTDGNLIEEDTPVADPDAPLVTADPDIDLATCHFKLTNPDGTVLIDKTASQLGITTGMKEIEVKLSYTNSILSLSSKEIVYSPETWVDGDGQNGRDTKEENPLESLSVSTSNLKNNSVFTVYDTNKTWYRRVINPQTGNVHDEILDLAYNVENIEYDVDEEDTFTAISPVLGSSNNNLTKSQMDQIISQWKALSVTKGDVVPMIVEKSTSENAPTDEFMAQSVVSSNYYARPVAPNDSEGKYEYLKASSYWKAPYSKHAGEMHVTDEEIKDVDYTGIYCRPDVEDPRKSGNTQKMGTVSTSDENPYAIFNDVCMKLKDKSEPEITIDVDVANLIDHKYNDYDIYDKVYIKVPGFEKVITAEVSKTTKEAHDLNKNKITLSNYSINTKVAPIDTYITGSNVSYTYPETSKLDVVLHDADDNGLKGKLINLSVYSQSTFYSTYTRVTKDDGSASLPLRLGPGEYTIKVEFPGDVEYASSEQSYSVNVGGTVQEDENSEGGTVTETTYYSQYGVSPDGKTIMAIGRPSASGESSYGYTFYKSVYQRKCPHCGSTELVWGIFWAGNETSNYGYFPGNGHKEGGSAEGHIFCKKCDSDYSCILGKEHVSGGRSLTRVSGPTKCSKQDAYTLKNGQMVCQQKTTTVDTKANTNANRAGPIANDIPESVKQKGLAVAGASTGLDAAKKIAQWVASNISYESYNNFQRRADRVLSTGRGNCCDQTRLMLQMMDAAGVTAQYQLIYVHVVSGSRGHVFAKINGTYVDPCKAQPWGNYVTGYGVPGSAPNSVYPRLPF